MWPWLKSRSPGKWGRRRRKRRLLAWDGKKWGPHLVTDAPQLCTALCNSQLKKLADSKLSKTGVNSDKIQYLTYREYSI